MHGFKIWESKNWKTFETKGMNYPQTVMNFDEWSIALSKAPVIVSAFIPITNKTDSHTTFLH